MIYINSDVQLYLLIYVDDLLLTRNNSEVIQQLLSQLQVSFSLKQLGNVSLFLGLQVNQTNQGLFLHQTHYTREILNSFCFISCKVAITPMSLKSSQKKFNTDPYDNPTHYRQLAGSLHYLTVTRLDIAYATNAICQHMHNPTDSDHQALKRLLRYLKGTQNLCDPIKPGDLNVTAYSDVDWATDLANRKSISNFCTYLDNNLISWSVKKQSAVAKSSTEAEYHALASATSEVIWLCRLFTDFKAHQTQPTKIYCDSISGLALANNPVFHARIKYIEIDYHFMSDHIKNKDIDILHISSIDQPTDILTKALAADRLITLPDKLTIRCLNTI
ncbi:hypothetical protein KFK09_026038 [Dendrobium nobile]|uniref:Reverse transcriptase Ty1/copia-type domain-containing protein n=1 Tax=Dendrobium nobile TaxID=94219 RepID=A0A8T3A6M5_DENNO|nr:hypothetical protein KFK09_026038 [Dendrobium nobile]